MRGLQLTDVVKNLLIINVLMFLGTQFLGEPNLSYVQELVSDPTGNASDWGRNMLAVFFPTSEYFRPYQIITHMFMHADVMHIFFNMFALYMFGPPLENFFGPKKFFVYYFITALGAMGLHMLVSYLQVEYFGNAEWALNVPMLGASGAVFGLLAGYGMTFPNQKIMLLIPPIPMKAKYFVLIYAAVELFQGVRGFNTGVAHFAHLGGAIFGVLIILYWRNYGSKF